MNTSVQTTWPLRTPEAMVRNLTSGRYAVAPDDNTPLTFVRVTRPTYGKKKDCLVIQTQHSERYKDCIIVRPSGRVDVYDNRVDSSLLLIVVDPVTATIRYGKELEKCCDCGRKLTDARSRWYGVGPECEKDWEELINYIDEEKGPYRG